MTAPWNASARLDAYLRRSRAAGIDRTVVFAPFHTDYAKANREVAQIVARHAPRLIGFAFVHPIRDAGRIHAMVEEAVRKWGFRGIKVHGYDAHASREVCEAARAFGIPLLVDVAGQSEVVDLLAREFPDVTFVIPHLGSFRDDWRAQQQVVYQIARYPNVYADTSGVRRFEYLVEAVKLAGPSKLIFGSDGPWLHPGLELHKIRLLGLPAQQEKMIVGQNAYRILSGNVRRMVPGAARRAGPVPAVRPELALAAVASTGRDGEPREREL